MLYKVASGISKLFFGIYVTVQMFPYRRKALIILIYQFIMRSRYLCMCSPTSRYDIHYLFMLSFIITVYYGNYWSERLLGVKVTWYVTCDDRREHLSICPTFPPTKWARPFPRTPTLRKRRRAIVAIRMRTAPTTIIMCSRLRICKLSQRPLRNCFSNNDVELSFIKFMIVGVVYYENMFE